MRKILCLVLIAMAALVGCKGPDAAVGGAIESFAANHHANYVASFADRYAAYAGKHGDIPYSSILVAVNLGLDQPNYENIYLLKDPQSITVLVNKHYGLQKKFRPDHLVTVDGAGYGEGRDEPLYQIRISNQQQTGRGEQPVVCLARAF
jgi:hypothetical protein